jgi:hypothetical protein
LSKVVIGDGSAEFVAAMSMLVGRVESLQDEVRHMWTKQQVQDPTDSDDSVDSFDELYGYAKESQG